MATQHISSALQPPALSDAYPMANPGYGKRSAPDQLPRGAQDFSLLPTRERYVAGFVDHLPEGASMSVKQLAKQLPLYGQQAISTALTALSVAGHLRRVRCPVGAGEETRWVFRTFWSRTARDNEWWNTFLATETATAQAAITDAAVPPPPARVEEPLRPAPVGVGIRRHPESPSVPQQRSTPPTGTAPQPPSTLARKAATPPAAEPGPSPAYVALARLGREDHRLALSADDCAALEPRAAEWLARGVSVDYLTTALTAGLPAEINSPVGFLRRRLTTKLPPHLPPATTTRPTPAAPAARVLVECTECGTPGPSEALPDGLCRPCRETCTTGPGDPSPVLPTPPDIKTHMANLRNLLKPV
ncbi:MarR family transcriptional regulator [Streptomyces sp. OUCMDZ-4982]|uniref:MarR family transcriptional regulator n=1 Tax=Streptomyces sp. OUCMDZ-4982 TaxID=2973090 RepID=UPI00215BC5B7|nr:MarR family transcriptional regulator [Streptomyces sp. OUCMDZ-4982]MCR8945968.1 MarR family transcriptional regulator [Streptomyces sp. OUCMDZ-4982]